MRPSCPVGPWARKAGSGRGSHIIRHSCQGSSGLSEPNAELLTEGPSFPGGPELPGLPGTPCKEPTTAIIIDVLL